MNRMLTLSDTGYNASSTLSLVWEYDLAGNVRRREVASAPYLDAQGNISVSSYPLDYWYKYDAMNRFVVTEGTFTGTRGSGSISAGTGTGGMTITYDLSGERATMATAQSVTYYDADVGHNVTYTETDTDTYTYTADGFLARVDYNVHNTGINHPTDPGSVERAIYVLDAMGRATSYSE
jgi:hypothetical protein